ncbi:ThiF family adenylyltransferase [Vibrio vulnificus]|uniref:ThiF family adenylyltransferase n=1 Tax=Vibrio vulnificus TaxID=672 RepID=UPI001A1E74B8|nr:ThiF family adenylyltransferase [Vibrio vulnificus]HAT8489397.1 ThiF family adenylyltransferase [Vibrio vulnificus]HDY7969545.1 ThiF family adenylyltransferase [Vibrio vulnificus]HDY8012370.1 ThiF family adenylyltransferase [Vibrio vulnificus]
MKNRKLKIKESVDVYTFKSDQLDKVRVQFYKINTREKITIEIDHAFLSILSSLDGLKTISEVFNENNLEYDFDELKEIIEYLMSKGLIIEKNEQELIDSYNADRYSRQINYFDDLISEKTGECSQIELMNKKVLIIGCGSTGGIISTQLAMSGVKKFVLWDYKKTNRGSLTRHIYVNNSNYDLYKVDSLGEHLKSIDSRIVVKSYKSKLLPNTNLDNYIDEDIDIVINTADEPYIGHISVKLGRYLWSKKIGLYVSGGFDAHLMSSGELIHNGMTPCIDCCSTTFKKALSNWKPKYNQNIETKANDEEESLRVNIGGAGGLFPHALYSSSLACMNIIDYLLLNEHHTDKCNKRGEFLVERCEQTWFEMRKQDDCKICKS